MAKDYQWKIQKLFIMPSVTACSFPLFSSWTPVLLIVILHCMPTGVSVADTFLMCLVEFNVSLCPGPLHRGL